MLSVESNNQTKGFQLKTSLCELILRLVSVQELLTQTTQDFRVFFFHPPLTKNCGMANSFGLYFA